MVKVVILLDCDECGRSLERASISSTPKREQWERQIGLSMHDAEFDGWRFMRDYAICPECIQEEIKMSDLLEEPEDYFEYRI